MTTRRDETEGPKERYEHSVHDVQEELGDRRQVGYPGAKEETSWQAANHDVARFTDELRGISDKAATAFDDRHDLGNYSSTERKEIIAAFDKSFKNVEFHGDEEARHDLAQDISQTIFDPIRNHVEKLEYQLQTAKEDGTTSYSMADHETSQAAMNYFQENFADALEHPDPDKASADTTSRMETLVRYSTIHFNEANIKWADHNERTDDAVREVVERFEEHHNVLESQMNDPRYSNPFPPGGEERFIEMLGEYRNEIETTEVLIGRRAMDHNQNRDQDHAHAQEVNPSINALIEKSSRINEALQSIGSGA